MELAARGIDPAGGSPQKFAQHTPNEREEWAPVVTVVVSHPKDQDVRAC
jgi:hypothetical protein